MTKIEWKPIPLKLGTGIIPAVPKISSECWLFVVADNDFALQLDIKNNGRLPETLGHFNLHSSTPVGDCSEHACPFIEGTCFDVGGGYVLACEFFDKHGTFQQQEQSTEFWTELVKLYLDLRHETFKDIKCAECGQAKPNLSPMPGSKDYVCFECGHG